MNNNIYKTLLPKVTSQAQASTQYSSSLDVSGVDFVNILPFITAVSGSPTSFTLGFVVEGSLDGNTWYTIRDLKDIVTSSTGVYVGLVQTAVWRFIRVGYTISFTGGSTPSATFLVEAQLVDTKQDIEDTIKESDFDYTTTFTSARASYELVAAPGANKALYIKELILSNGGTAGDIKIIENTASAVVKIPKLYTAANDGHGLYFERPIQITENKNIGLISTTVAGHSVLIRGFKGLVSI